MPETKGIEQDGQAGGWAAVSAPEIQGVLGTRREERGLSMSVPCCLGMLGVHDPSWELNVCQLPSPYRDRPCLGPRGRGGSESPIVSAVSKSGCGFL